jgi:hypothetical protein
LVGSLRGERKTKKSAEFLIEEELNRAIRLFSKGKERGKETFKGKPAQGSDQNRTLFSC